MEDTIIENENSLNNEPVEETTPAVDVEKLQEANRKLYERVKQAEHKLKEVSKTPTKEVDSELASKVDTLYLEREKHKFGYENQLSPEETDFIFKYSNGKPTKELFDDPFIKSGLEGYRQSKRAANNTPGTTNRSQSYSSSDGKFSEEDHRKHFEQRSKEVLKK